MDIDGVSIYGTSSMEANFIHFRDQVTRLHEDILANGKRMDSLSSNAADLRSQSGHTRNLEKDISAMSIISSNEELVRENEKLKCELGEKERKHEETRKGLLEALRDVEESQEERAELQSKLIVAL